MAKDEARLRAVYNAGVMPFAQLYKDENDSIKYDDDYKLFARQWSRPASAKAHMERGTMPWETGNTKKAEIADKQQIKLGF